MLWRILWLLLGNLALLLLWPLRGLRGALARVSTRGRPLYVEVALGRDHPLAPAKGLARMGSRPTSILELKELFKSLAENPRVAGVIVRVAQTPVMGAARLGELADLVRLLREVHGKHVVTWLPYNAFTAQYELALAGEHILLSPAGRLSVSLPEARAIFLTRLLQMSGIGAQFVHIGAFKTAAHRFLHTGMTAPQRLVMRELLEGRAEPLLQGLSPRLGKDAPNVQAALAAMPTSASEAIAQGLVDAEVYPGQIRQWLEQREDFRLRAHAPTEGQRRAPKSRPHLLSSKGYLAAFAPPMPWIWPLFPPPAMALVELHGVIASGEAPVRPTGPPVIHPEVIIPLLAGLRRDPSIAGVLLHIDSPGGSAHSSELMWQAIRELDRHKPVVAYCLNYAASGGYYMALGARRIVCHPQTLTGSIGVVAGRFHLRELAGRLGIDHELVHMGPAPEMAARMHSPLEVLDPREMERLREDAREFYRLFLRRVGESRQLARHRLHQYARGRVYRAPEAWARGLVDGVGTMEQAMDLLRGLCGKGGQGARFRHVAARMRGIAPGTAGLAPTAGTLCGGCAPACEILRALELASAGGVLALLDIDVGDPPWWQIQREAGGIGIQHGVLGVFLRTLFFDGRIWP